MLDKLTMLNAPKATVVRGGKKAVVNAEDLVLDDIVIFKAGNQVCADAVVCAGEVQVNESLLTGEADEIAKGEGREADVGKFCRVRPVLCPSGKGGGGLLYFQADPWRPRLCRRESSRR